MTFMGLKIANNGTFVFLFGYRAPITPIGVFSIYMYPCNTLGASLIKMEQLSVRIGPVRANIGTLVLHFGIMVLSSH